MRLTIVYDSEALPGFGRGWGFSCLIERGEERLLFDAGWDGALLCSNLRELGIRPEGIGRVVLSHAHWDHLGGLTHLLRRGMHLYVPSSLSGHLKEELSSRSRLHEVRKAGRIGGGIWTTGELGGEVGEQALALKTGRGWVVVVGCAHPGLRRIFSVVSRWGRIAGVVGGMHDFEDYGVLRGLDLIVPCHCTAHRRRIAELFPEAYEEGRAGLEIIL